MDLQVAGPSLHVFPFSTIHGLENKGKLQIARENHFYYKSVLS